MSKRVGVIIAAGGSSQRMNGIDKILVPLCGVPVIAKTCLAFQVNETVSEIVVSSSEDKLEYITELLESFGITKLKAVVCGGDSRFDSVCNALAELSECEYVAIHDGARPLVSQKLINEYFETAFKYGAAVPVLPSVDTLKIIDGKNIVRTIDRNKVFRVQTPQVFEKTLYETAVRDYGDSLSTDDCVIFEKAGHTVHTCNGADENIKLTVPSDISYAEFLLKGEGLMIRVGHGYDVHKLVQDRKLILCGVDIPYEKGLLGHSDADVAVHAVMDSLLGASSLGDIGKLFPDTDQTYKGANSIQLLKRVSDIVNTSGYTIGNIDVTIVAQKPKLAPYVEQMTKNIAIACGVPASCVSVKATTEEGLGFTGSGEGISAFAVCSLMF